MNFWNLFFGMAEDAEHAAGPEMGVNPANGLPMIEGGAIDIEGNPFGTSASDFDAFHSFSIDD